MVDEILFEGKQGGGKGSVVDSSEVDINHNKNNLYMCTFISKS